MPSSPQSAGDELRLVSSMLRRFGGSLSAKQAEDIAARIDAVALGLQNAPNVADPVAQSHVGLRTVVPAPPRDRDAARPDTRADAKPDAKAEARPLTSARRKSNVSVASSAGSKTDSALLPRLPTPAAPSPASVKASPRAHRTPSVCSTHHGDVPEGSAAVVKVTARTLNALDRAQTTHQSAQRAAEKREMQTAVGAAVFVALEGLMTRLHAESGAVYVPIADEMVSIATIFPTLPTFPPPLVKHLAAGSVSGSVLSSGVAVHQSGAGLDDNNRRVPSQLLMPMISATGTRLGVLQLTGKYRGAAKFSDVDEAVAYDGACLLAAVLTRYKVEWAGPMYDPVALHKSSPWVPATISREIYETIPPEMREHRAAPLIHRTGSTISLAKRLALADDPAALGTAPTLRELDAYLDNLQDCWRRSVELNIEHGQQEQERISQLRAMREELRAAKDEVRRVNDRLRLEHLDVSDYRNEYSTLKQELDRFLERKRAFDD